MQRQGLSAVPLVDFNTRARSDRVELFGRDLPGQRIPATCLTSCFKNHPTLDALNAALPAVQSLLEALERRGLAWERLDATDHIVAADRKGPNSQTADLRDGPQSRGAKSGHLAYHEPAAGSPRSRRMPESSFSS